MPVSHIDIVSVPVTDQDRAKRFYTDVLGFRVVVDDPSDGRRWVMLAAPAGGAKITLVTWLPAMPPGSQKGLVLSCTELEDTYAAIAAHEVKITSQIEEAGWARWFGLEDPDGNAIVIQEEP